MASIENKSRTQVSVKNRDDLTKLFPHDKLAAASAYVAELTKDGHKPSLMVLDEAYLVRFKVKGKRCTHLLGISTSQITSGSGIRQRVWH
ncbi:MAG: hypothetical protein ACK4XK_05530 [Casimicrobiaceae bacterium]